MDIINLSLGGASYSAIEADVCRQARDQGVIIIAAAGNRGAQYIGDDSSGTITMEHAFAMGASMASPHVAGVVALMKALYPGLTPDTFDALQSGGYLTEDLGDSGWVKIGLCE